jgi:hypothetical protein
MVYPLALNKIACARFLVRALQLLDSIEFNSAKCCAFKAATNLFFDDIVDVLKI